MSEYPQCIHCAEPIDYCQGHGTQPAYSFELTADELQACADWHSGQASAMYAAASTGALRPSSNALKYRNARDLAVIMADLCASLSAEAGTDWRSDYPDKREQTILQDIEERADEAYEYWADLAESIADNL